MSERLSPPRRDHGFTLPEVIVVVVMTGILAVVIAAVFSVIVRTAPATEARADDARTLLSLSRWLPVDVMSTEPTGFATGDGPVSCTTASPIGRGVLSLQWSEDGSTFRSYYRFVPREPGKGQIMRFTCVNGGTAAELSMSTIIEDLPANPRAYLVAGPTPGTYIGVNFEVDIIEPSTGLRRELLSLDARTANRPSTLSSLPTGPAAPPPGYIAPTAGELRADVVPGSTITFQLPITGEGILDISADGAIASNPAPTTPADEVSVSFATVVFATDATVSLVVPPSIAEPSTATIPYRVTDFFGASATNNIILNVLPSGSSTTTSTTPTTIPPCTASILSVSPNPVSNDNGPNNIDVNRLNDDVTVTITRSGSCAPLVLAFVPDPIVGTERTLAFNGALSVTIRKQDHQWRDGERLLVVREGASGQLASHILRVL